MKVIDPGHLYEVQNIDGIGVQQIQFVKRRGHDAELLPVNQRVEGIQSQELLRVLIDRSIYLNAEQPWSENIGIVKALREALRLYESRAARRHIEKLSMPERHAICAGCGHIHVACEH